MAELAELSTTLITSICAHLDVSSVLETRLACRSLKQKVNQNFLKTFETVKISLCKISIDALEEMTADTAIAAKIKQLTIGTETLDQYRHIVESMVGDDAEVHRGMYELLSKQESDEKTWTATRLREICYKLPNLKLITIEDRPAYRDSSSYNANALFKSVGSTKVQQLTGIDMRWNGPFTDPTSIDSHEASPLFPIASRRFAFAVVFILLRDLDILKKLIKFDLMIRGYFSFDEEAKVCKGVVPKVFDVSKSLPRRAFRNYMHEMSVNTYGAQSQWLDRVLEFEDESDYGVVESR